MNRRYTSAQFEAVVARARARVPDLAVTSDVIVGFPGEDEAAFEATSSAGAWASRVFTSFSIQGVAATVAAGLAGQYPERISSAAVNG